MGMLQGIANVYAVDAATQLLFEPLSVSFDEETSSKLSQRFNSSGLLVTSSEVQGTSQETGTITFNSTNWNSIAFARGQKPRTVASDGTLILPTSFVYATVPTSSPYEIDDAYITTANDALRGTETIKVTVTAQGGGIQAGETLARAATAATPADGEVGVDTTDNKLVFNAAQAGVNIFYPKYQTATAYQDIGGPTGFSSWGQFVLFGEIIDPSNGSDRYIFRCPQVTTTGKASFTLDDGVPELSVPVAFGAPTGEDTGVHLINKFGATFA